MIPLRDDVPSQRYPLVTVTIIALNGGFVFGALLCSVIKIRHFYRRHFDEELT